MDKTSVDDALGKRDEFVLLTLAEVTACEYADQIEESLDSKRFLKGGFTL